jgi:hypothetical protein
MFRANNAPVTYSELTVFAQQVAHEVDRLRLDPQVTELVFAVAHSTAVRLQVITAQNGCRSIAPLDQLLARRPRMGATVTTVGWSPDTAGPTAPAWMLVAVGIGGAPSVAAVRRFVEDQHWWQLDTAELPWFALSTAAGLRAALDDGVPLRLKEARRSELFHRPSETPRPPVDERGEL